MQEENFRRVSVNELKLCKIDKLIYVEQVEHSIISCWIVVIIIIKEIIIKIHKKFL